MAMSKKPAEKAGKEALNDKSAKVEKPAVATAPAPAPKKGGEAPKKKGK